MYKECVGCKSENICNVAVQPGSVMCQINRLKSGQTKAELESSRRNSGIICPHCGRTIYQE